MSEAEKLFERAMELKAKLQALAAIVQNEGMEVSAEDLEQFRSGADSLIASIAGWKSAILTMYEERHSGQAPRRAWIHKTLRDYTQLNEAFRLVKEEAGKRQEAILVSCSGDALDWVTKNLFVPFKDLADYGLHRTRGVPPRVGDLLVRGTSIGGVEITEITEDYLITWGPRALLDTGENS